MTSPKTDPMTPLHWQDEFRPGSDINPPYGGTLVNLLKEGDEWAALKREATGNDDYTLSPRQTCDLELLMNGGFSPLRGFMNQDDYLGCVNNMRLANNTLWPMPITLDVSAEQAGQWSVGKRLNLRDSEQNLLAILTVESIYKPDKALEAEKVYGSADDRCHPAIDYLFTQAGDTYVGGAIEGLQLPPHYDFVDLRFTPSELRANIRRQGWRSLVGFQTRNPMHRSHRELTLMAARDAKANVLIHPVVGMTKPGDIDHYTRVRVYKEIIKTYPSGMASLSLLPLAMRMAGPREAVWHAIIRKNYGCSHFVVGRDHAGPGKNRDGNDFYGSYDAQELVKKHKEEIGIEVLFYQHVVYIEELGEYRTLDNIPEGMRSLSISGTELRRRLFQGIDIPEWFTFPEVVKILRSTYPPRIRQGFCLFFTGLSGSGKSTVANAVRIALLEEGSRTCTLLDGDYVRRHLSSELGFSKEHRDLNIKRIGFVASEIVKAGGVATCAAIAPYAEPRDYCRKLCAQNGGFVEIHISTPLEVCEARDRKGLYAKARAGVIKGFTGIDDPYEAPKAPEITIDTSKVSVRQAVHEVILWLEQAGYLGRA